MRLFLSKAEIAGKTILAKGEVNATDNSNTEKRKLRRRSKIFSVDNITTGDKSKAQFSMVDGGLITLKENTEIKISGYHFDKSEEKGSATLEVVSGGLRSISGLIKKSGGDYQVNTPVGSIGIRGTHFAVHVSGDNVLFGVFSGDIDVQLVNEKVLSLGVSEKYSFASVSSTGQVILLTQAPKEISTNSINIETSEQSSEQEEQPSIQVSTTPQRVTNDLSGYVTVMAGEDDYATAYNESELQGMDGTSIEELISQRSGTLNYHNIGEGAILSTAGSVQGLNVEMTIDFDNGSIPKGTLSYSDQQGVWFAGFSGLINVDQLDLGVNFASHGNKKATGDVSAAFSNGLEEVIGSFELHEIENTEVVSGGSFKVIAD